MSGALAVLGGTAVSPRAGAPVMDTTAPSRCRSCGAHVYWAWTKAGKRMPVDLAPVEDGNLCLARGVGRYLVVWVARPTESGPRYRCHYSTCPEAARYRRDHSPRARVPGATPAGTHPCAVGDCLRLIAGAYLMCREHWGLVPRELQRRVWRNYTPGQTPLWHEGQGQAPSPEWIEAALEAVEAVERQKGVA